MRLFFISIILFTTFLRSTAQEFSSDNADLSAAFKLAVETVDINTRRGILAAGGDYGGEWTRDIAINSWNGVSLLRSKVAEESLWSVTIDRDTVGHQYWDKILWVIAADNHYHVTGDYTFLKQAYACSTETMKHLEEQVFDQQYGLFRGPSVFNDGIAAYPEPIYEPNNHSSSVLDHKNSAVIKCLSTNCAYYGAYLALVDMSKTLKLPADTMTFYLQRAQSLKENILKHFYNPASNTFIYLIDQNGQPAAMQEGLGISFAVMFGIIDGENAAQMIRNAVVSKYGITSITPDLPRYSAAKPGRHNNIVWPMVNGFFAQAAADTKSYGVFTQELFNLGHLALDEDKGDYDFREVYNPYTGRPDGGWQANGNENPDYHWASLRLQTWSATAYLSMVIHGLFGLRPANQCLSFLPYLPVGVTKIEMKRLPYRNAILDILIIGQGKTIESFTGDGKRQIKNEIPQTIAGKHTLFIVLGNKRAKD